MQFETELLALGLLSRSEADEVRREAEAEIEAAIRFAGEAADPDPAALLRDVVAA